MRQKTFIQAALACLLTGLISIVSSIRISKNYLNIISYSNHGIVNTLAAVYLLVLLVYIFTGLRKGLSNPIKAQSTLAFWQGALRYVIAFDLCVFGIGKFFDIQFNIPITWLTTPVRDLSSHDLLFAFYGRYAAFARIIGAIQIAGALLLIFRRTRLAGVMILLPVILNLVLLNSFYLHATLYYVIILALGLIYLLLIDYNRLKKFFFTDREDQPYYQFKNSALKSILKSLVVIVPLSLMFIHPQPQVYPEIDGEYSVEKLRINNETKSLEGRSDSVLTKVFIDKDDIVFEYNNYKKRLIGSYSYNSATRQLKGWWHYPDRVERDTLFATVSRVPGNGMKTLKGRMGKENIDLELKKMPVVMPRP